MKDYHFEKDDHEFDQTIRLDDINEEMKKLEKDKTEDDLGDKDAFLDAFESEKFDQFPEENMAKIPSVPSGTMPDDHGDEPFFNKKTVTIISAVAVVVAIACFALVRGMFPTGNRNDLPESQVPVLIQGVLDGGELIVYDIKHDVNKSIDITEETVITNAQGQITPEVQFNTGDLVLVSLGRDGKSVQRLNFGGEIQVQEITGLTPDIASNQLLGENGKAFKYGKEAMFLYNQEEISPKELEPCDVLVLKSYENVVWVVDVAEYHGYISIENKDNIVNGMFKLDEEDEVPLEEAERIPVKEGTHTITVSGDNIEKRTDSIFVETGEVYVYDLSQAQEKVGVLIINANVTDYKLYINGTLVDSTVPSVLPMGEYDVVILKNGYTEWSQHVVLDTDTLSIDANLQQDIQFGTVVISANVDNAQIYIDGKEMGFAPIELNLPYGSYSMEVDRSGYEPYFTTILVNSSSTYMKVELEKE